MVYECYVDGASRGQGSDGQKTGHGAIAVLIYKNRKLIGQYARALGRRTNSEAEYEAVLLALIMCWSADLRNPIIYTDSEMVAKQISGKWVCNNERLIPLLHSVREIEEDFRFKVQHVPRKYVREADTLVNQFLDKVLIPKKAHNR